MPGGSQARTKGNEGVFVSPVCAPAPIVSRGKGPRERPALPGRPGRVCARVRARIRTTTVARSQLTVVPRVERGRATSQPWRCRRRRLSRRKKMPLVWPIPFCPPSSRCSSFSSSSSSSSSSAPAPLPFLAPVERYAAIGHSWSGSMMLAARV